MLMDKRTIKILKSIYTNSYTVEEISQMLKCDTSVIQTYIEDLSENHYISKDGLSEKFMDTRQGNFIVENYNREVIKYLIPIILSVFATVISVVSLCKSW